MSVPMGLAHLDSGLDDDQIQSLVHRLRHEWADQHPSETGNRSRPGGGIDAPPGDAEQWARFRDRITTHVTGRPTLRPQRRAGLLRRLHEADQPPAADMLWAAERIRDRAVRSARLLDDHLSTESARIGVPDAEAFTVYSAGRGSAPTGRQPRASDDQQEQWPDLPLDPRTRHGLAALAARPDNADGRHDLIVDHPAPDRDSARVAGVGYHADSGRLEILTRDGALLAYRAVESSTAAALNDDPDRVLHEVLSGNPDYQYRDAVQAVAAGVRRRCSHCGQFTGATHNCQGTRSTVLPDATTRATPEPVLSNTEVAAATAAAIATRPATEALLPHAPNLSTFSYRSDPIRFAADVRAAMQAPPADRVPLLTGTEESAMYGFGAGREFGIEIEFDVASGLSRRDALHDIGATLYAQEFTRTSTQVGYHSALHGGYTRDLRRGWSYEQDGSVSGELVSPILRNQPETWEQLDRACRLMAARGGVASANTGSHITVSAADVAGKAVRLTRFLRLMYHHQGDLHTMSAAGHDRPMNYSGPLRPPPLAGYTRIGDGRRPTPGTARGDIGRYNFVNIAHIAQRSTDSDAPSSRIEFRLWDGSLHAGRIQAQVKMSAALLDYAVHHRDLNLDSTRRAGSATQLNPDTSDFAEQTTQIRDLIDGLFRRDADKRQAAALWAAGLAARQGRRHALT